MHVGRRECRRAAAELGRRRRVFFALQTIGRVPAMLNFSAGPANVLSA